MKRRKFLTNTSIALAGISAPMGLAAMTAPSVTLTASQLNLLAAFKLTLTDYPCSALIRQQLASVASVEFSDENIFRFRSLTGERCELKKSGDRITASLLG
ncbi:hypothetical protein FUA23_06665 [Neolewinella aurantiaca]|uniref:Uncharacterized protein n=1 Tax=Neolewinella aurantiaca TaxID=2602767 RepID=A0A5C7FKL8_9BACT|nr:hypothetical protein [Neolewinella aurantiaca]TXF90464.1 hypothetical protein FUA23_06665 [Neolewinella aurantiaca]